MKISRRGFLGLFVATPALAQIELATQSLWPNDEATIELFDIPEVRYTDSRWLTTTGVVRGHARVMMVNIVGEEHRDQPVLCKLYRTDSEKPGYEVTVHQWFMNSRGSYIWYGAGVYDILVRPTQALIFKADPAIVQSAIFYEKLEEEV